MGSEMCIRDRHGPDLAGGVVDGEGVGVVVRLAGAEPVPDLNQEKQTTKEGEQLESLDSQTISEAPLGKLLRSRP